MRKIQKILSDKRGASFPLIVAVTLALMLIFCGVSEYFRLMIIAQVCGDECKPLSSLPSMTIMTMCIMVSAKDIQAPISHIVEDFEESLDYGDIYDRIDSIPRPDRQRPLSQKKYCGR
jgi:hypothetical protein